MLITGAKGTVVAGLVPLCVEKLVEEETSQLKVHTVPPATITCQDTQSCQGRLYCCLQEIILETLHWCFMVDTTDGLACDVITICQDLLEHVQVNIRGQAARLIYDLTIPMDGKEAACAVEGCVPRLIKLLDGQTVFTRAQALAALMRLATACHV